ncbi:KRAB-A domain-containing protein 2 [Trichinella sp. T6]|nr:KRAB-A domain-containing protein 2 [Trichinella sp. T6]
MQLALRNRCFRTRSNALLPRGFLDSQNCTLRVPDVDRGPADPKNFLVVVMAECEGLYTVGCRERKLASKFTAADLQVISENLLSIDEAPDAEIPLRTAVTKATGGQGYVKCMCLSGCSSGRCSCSRKRFCILSPLKSKRAEEVASKLLEIFLTFGAPSILQSDNGREFSNAIIAELKTYWPELKLVTGRPRHPQSQGAVERLNGVVQDKLAIWMRENGCKRWSMGLKFVQWQINVSVHETTGQSPFKVTFGEEPRIGLESYILPKSLVDAAKTEEEIEEFLTSHEANDEDSLNRDGKNYDENESSIMKHLPETFIKARKEAALGQTRAAAKMTRRTKKMLIPLQIGQNCTLRVPDVDRGPADPKNFLVVVMAECEGLYTVGCREGKLASKFTAADLQVISENLLSIDEAPDAEIPLRTAVTKATGGQGYVKCMCLSGCSSGRCSCSRKRVLCNSRCHPGKSCNNI